MRLRGVALAFLVALAVCVPSVASGSAQHAGQFQKCGNILPLTSWGVEAKGVGCTRAREVVRGYVRGTLEDGEAGSTGDVGAFHCRLSGTYIDGGLYRCTASGHRVIKFSRGG